MKKLKMSLILLVFGIIFSEVVMAQPPRPPLNQGTPGNQSPGNPTGSPIDPGTDIFLILATGYAIKKIYNIRIKTTV
jgi:hypothetical protein